MSRPVSDKIRDIFENRIQTPLIYFLVLVAYVARLTDWEHGANTAMLAAAMLGFRLLLDIYKKTAEPPPPSAFENFDAATPTIEAQLLQYFRTHKKGKIRYMGLVVYHWPQLNKFFNKLVELPHVPELSIEIVMMNPQWKGLGDLSPEWPEYARASAAAISTFQQRHVGVTKHQWEVDLKFYEGVSAWYGLLIDDEHLYLGTSYWENGRLRGGENPVHVFRTNDTIEGHRRIAEFNGWFDHYSKQLDPSNDPDDAT